MLSCAELGASWGSRCGEDMKQSSQSYCRVRFGLCRFWSHGWARQLAFPSVEMQNVEFLPPDWRMLHVLPGRGDLSFTCMHFSTVNAIARNLIFLILWFCDCFVFKIILCYQYPQQNSSRYIEASILIPCNQKRSQVFIAGRRVKKPVSLEDSKLLMVSHLEKVPFLSQLPPT